MPSPHRTRAIAGAILRDALAGRRPSAGPRLVPVDGDGDPAFLRDGLTIGRGLRSDLRVACPEVSRVHARIVAAGDGFAIADAGSKNGVAVNGAAVRENDPVRLRDGDVVLVGAVRLRVGGVHVAQAPSAPTPGRAPRFAARAVAGLLLGAVAALLAAAMLSAAS